MKEPKPRISKRPIPLVHLDPDAVKVVRRLSRFDHLAYFVGGCVRDLLLGCQPKDFDIATSAQPPELRKLFRNCRIIGRRFRLAHVMFSQGKIIEVATFRQDPATSGENNDLLLRRDNVFGEPHEDALRRDFTINALFYDLRRRQIIDYAGGLEDIERRVLRTIGDPNIRLQEDPVRILRAIKFAARQDLGMSPTLYAAALRHRELIARSAPARVFEELLRLLRGGAAHRSIWLAHEMGLIAELVPELNAFLNRSDLESRRVFLSLQAVDTMVRMGRRPSDAVLLAALFAQPLLRMVRSKRDVAHAIRQAFHPIAERLVIPKRIREQIRLILMSQRRFTDAGGRRRGRGRRDLLPEAVEFREIQLRVDGAHEDAIEEVRRIAVRSSRPRPPSRRRHRPRSRERA